MKVAVLDDWADALRGLECFRRLDEHEVTVWTDHAQDVDILADRLLETEALVLIRERTKISAELVAKLPALRLISQRSVYPHIDVQACTQAGIIVSSNQHPGTPSYAAAELTWGLVLAGARQIPAQMASLKAGGWQTGLGETLRGKALGIFGYGRIGRTVAGYGAAFGMRVLIWSSEASRSAAALDGYQAAGSKSELFADSDVVSLHVRLVPATRGIVTAADLAVMKPTAVLVNTARSGLIQPGALVAALESGRPGRAAVDVYENEPVTGSGDPIVGLPNVIATPHIGYVTREEFEIQFADVFDQVAAYAAGAPINVVNPTALRHPPIGPRTS